MQIVLTIISFLILSSQCLFAQAPPSAPVAVSVVTQKEVRKPVTLVGSVEPLRTSLVSAEISGIVVEYPYSEGDYVEEGQVIARQNISKLKLMLNEAINTKKRIKSQAETCRR